ncbi:hypothetical protein D8B26_003990 [Coccidioides posadasii str. Silveira]|uniref:Uncharacterized protein n=2 Tax=Coccidioides posadasii TaxID=199306 RepID=E9DJX8_COCPS|nr:hypothetical protein CPSG_10127 [Coccidioides posadasii str. Silveira]KMM70165.1 hypothetical protein CPAG_06477 [Coccidioides posadasii RMSCC 3488]QVM09327.1 hypothetical protein D8B26_003990 [Coccidioides posadasii str. Silveira]
MPKIFTQTERGLQEAPVLRQDSGVFRDIWKAGGLRHVVTIPLIKVDDAQVFAWRKNRERVTVNWDWREAIFTPELTHFEVEQGRKVGAVVVQFEPTESVWAAVLDGTPPSGFVGLSERRGSRLLWL